MATIKKVPKIGCCDICEWSPTRKISKVTRLRDICSDGNISVPLRRILVTLPTREIIYYVKPEIVDAILHYKDGTKLVIRDSNHLMNACLGKRVILNPSKLSESVRENLKYSFTS